MNSSVLAQQVCLWFCPQDGADVGLRTVCTVLTGPGHGRPGRSAAAVLVKEVGQTHGGNQGGGQAKACGGVAAVFLAGADLSVVLLEHGGVAVPALGVLLVAAASDHALITADVLVDFSAEVGPVGGVGGAVLEELHSLGLVRAVLVVEGVLAVEAVVGVALVALYAGACLNEAEDKEGCCQGEEKL